MIWENNHSTSSSLTHGNLEDFASIYVKHQEMEHPLSTITSQEYAQYKYDLKLTNIIPL